MMVYQVNCQVNKAVAERWEKYFLEVHLDDVLSSGCFTGYSFRKGLETGETVLFASEYYYNSEADLERYNAEFAAALKTDIMEKFGGEFTASRNIFKEIISK